MKKRTVQLSSGETDFDIIRSSRRTVALYIKPGGTLLVRAPWYVPVHVIRSLIIEKEQWILRHREKLPSVKPGSITQTFENGSEIYYLGRKLLIRSEVRPKYNVFLSENTLIIEGPGVTSGARVKALVEGWYITESKRCFRERTKELVSKYGDKLPEPRSVNIRKMKSRWGTCKGDGSIWFNRELIKAKPELIDSVILHELCHLVHHNHGKEFYHLLASVSPDYKQCRKELRELHLSGI